MVEEEEHLEGCGQEPEVELRPAAAAATGGSRTWRHCRRDAGELENPWEKLLRSFVRGHQEHLSGFLKLPKPEKFLKNFSEAFEELLRSF